MRRTNNDIFRQLEELQMENEGLKWENKKLRAENAKLHKRIDCAAAGTCLLWLDFMACNICRKPSSTAASHMALGFAGWRNLLRGAPKIL